MAAIFDRFYDERISRARSAEKSVGIRMQR